MAFEFLQVGSESVEETTYFVVLKNGAPARRRLSAPTRLARTSHR
jgi:hypothetical protein